MKNIPMKYFLHFFAFIFIVSSSAFSQENKIKRGNKDFDKFSYINSRDIYLKVVEKGYESQDIYQNLGDSYYFTAELQEASKWYELLIQKYEESVSPEYLFRYAQSLKSVEKYDEADQIMAKFYAANPSDSRGTNFEDERNYLDFIELQSGRFDLKPFEMNSENSDFAPTFYGEQLVIASSRPEGNASVKKHKWNDQPFSDLYVTNQGNEKSDVTNLSKKINTKYHESTATFSKDGNTVYFTRNNYTNNKFKKSTDGANLLKLYRSEKVNGKWSKAVELPFNSDEYSTAHPALSPDEKTLYFASDMPGGKGLSDLYKVTITEDGFGTPLLLGGDINTEGRETFPFIAENGDLYFSSDGHPGLGGLDVFVAEQSEDGFYSESYNIGRPVNSPSDDFTFVINPETGIGYFASNRAGGVGSDDIYTFKQNKELIKSCIQSLAGIVKDKNTNQILPGATVVLVDVQGNVIAETISGTDGSFEINPIYCDKTYALRGTMINYTPDEVSFATSSTFSEEVTKTLYLAPKVPVIVGNDLNKILNLNPIYFDLDKSFIRPDAEIELQKVIAAMNQYPDLKIDVRSHTDSRANDDYNIRLSQRRNASTIKYIVEKGGISADRLTGKGYGETQLVNECSNDVPCSEEKHQLNRRSEFIIVDN